MNGVIIILILTLLIPTLGIYAFMILCKKVNVEFTYYGDRYELRGIDNLKITKINIASFECVSFIPHMRKYVIFTFNISEIFDLKPNIN